VYMPQDNVSKELFQSEVTNIKDSVDDLKHDIKQVGQQVQEISVCLNTYCGVSDTKFRHIEETMLQAAKNMDKLSHSIQGLSTKVDGVNTEVSVLKKYPAYTKWMIGIFVGIATIWKFIKDSV